MQIYPKTTQCDDLSSRRDTESDRETIDTSIYRYAEKKSIQIGSVETLLKRGAIDRFFYPDVNVIRKGVISKIRARPPVYQSLELSVDPSDKKYSKVCSYSSDCDYNHDLPSLDIDQLNVDTYLDEYSINNIQSIKQKDIVIIQRTICI